MKTDHHLIFSHFDDYVTVICTHCLANTRGATAHEAEEALRKYVPCCEPDQGGSG